MSWFKSEKEPLGFGFALAGYGLAMWALALVSVGQSWQSLPFMGIGIGLMLLGAQLLLG